MSEKTGKYMIFLAANYVELATELANAHRLLASLAVQTNAMATDLPGANAAFVTSDSYRGGTEPIALAVTKTAQITQLPSTVNGHAAQVISNVAGRDILQLD